MMRKISFCAAVGGCLLTAVPVLCLAAEPVVPVVPVVPGAPEPGLAEPGPMQGKQIAFVFEDGPLPQTTYILLDALKKLGMRATFAVTAENVEANPGLARRIVAEGHELANHAYSHPDLRRLSPAEVIREIQTAQETITRITGVKPRFFRATNGELDESLRPLVQQQGLEVLDATLDSGDWRKPSTAKLKRTIVGGAEPGAVILAHESFQQSAKEMPAIFEELVKNGFVLCTVGELHPPGSNPGSAAPTPAPYSDDLPVN